MVPSVPATGRSRRELAWSIPWVPQDGLDAVAAGERLEAPDDERPRNYERFPGVSKRVHSASKRSPVRCTSASARRT